MAKLVLAEGAAQPTPAANTVVLYAKTDGLLYSKDDAGNESQLTSSALTLDQILNLISLRA